MTSSATPPGRLLVYFPDADLSDGAAEAESHGYFDIHNAPPWGTWEALRWELEETGVTVCSVHPGGIRTNIVRILLEEDGHEHPAFDTLFSLDARELSAIKESDHDPLEPFVVVPADPTQTAALLCARQGKNAIIQGLQVQGSPRRSLTSSRTSPAKGSPCSSCARNERHRLSQRGLDELSVLDRSGHPHPMTWPIISLFECFACWFSTQ